MIKKIYKASIKGLSHEKEKKPNQDAFYVINKDPFVAVVCDGLGSKKNSHIGSKTLSKYFAKYVYNCKSIDEFIANFEEFKENYFKNVYNKDPRSLASTILAIKLKNDHLQVYQLGDGAIFLQINGDFIAHVDDNEEHFANVTDCLTPESNIYDINITSYEINDKKNLRIMICTDGLSEAIKDDMVIHFMNKLSSHLSTFSNKQKNKKFIDVIYNFNKEHSFDDKTVVFIEKGNDNGV